VLAAVIEGKHQQTVILHVADDEVVLSEMKMVVVARSLAKLRVGQ